MKQSRLRVSKKSIMLFGAFCMWIAPTYLYNVSFFMFFSNSFVYLAIAAFLIDFCRNFRRSSIVFCLIVVSVVIQGVATSMLNPGLLVTYVRQYSKTIAFCYFMDKFTREGGVSKNINVLLHYLEMMIVVNFITLILFPNGMYVSGSYSRNFWMGYDNTHIRWQIPALAISYIYSFVVNKRIGFRTVLLSLVILLSTIIVGSGTAIIAVVVFAAGMLYILLGKRKDQEKGPKLFMPLSALVISIIGSILIVGGTIAGSQVGFVAQIAEWLGKDSATLTGRSYIWTSSLATIKEHLIWGVGYETSEMTSMRLVNRIGYGLSPHNFCLDVLYNGGIILAIIVILIYVVLQFKLSKYKKLPVISICGLWLITISVMGLMEPQYNTQLRLAWIIVGNIAYLCQENGLCSIAEK